MESPTHVHWGDVAVLELVAGLAIWTCRGTWGIGQPLFRASSVRPQLVLYANTTPHGWYYFAFVGTLQLRDGQSHLQGSLLQHVQAQAALTPKSLLVQRCPSAS